MHLTNPRQILAIHYPFRHSNHHAGNESTHPSQYIYTQNNCIIFIQRRPNVSDVGPTLYKFYTNVFCGDPVQLFSSPAGSGALWRSVRLCRWHADRAIWRLHRWIVLIFRDRVLPVGVVRSVSPRRRDTPQLDGEGGGVLHQDGKGGGGGDTASTAAPTDPCARSYNAVSHILDRGQKEITVIHRSWLLHHACWIKSRFY